MKKILFLCMTCLATMSIQSQVLTSETIVKLYETVTTAVDSGLMYNADWHDGTIDTLWVYQTTTCGKGVSVLNPYYKYGYSYDGNGLLTSRITYRWHEGQWLTTCRYDYRYKPQCYTVEYCRYNHRTNTFREAADKMTFWLQDDQVSSVGLYHRNQLSEPYELVSQTMVVDGYINDSLDLAGLSVRPEKKK
ncbi:MAG: DUF3836 domain-containing protein [Prevotella sp.]|nr:DUF3836 domain-containing protein [Prevotella sp.]